MSDATTIDALGVLATMKIRTNTVAGAVQDVRSIVEADPSLAGQITEAGVIITATLGIDVPVFDDHHIARTAAQAVVEEIVKANGIIEDAKAMCDRAIARAKAYVSNPKNAWLFTPPESTFTNASTTVSTTSVALKGSSVTVEVKANGKLKKGEKQNAGEVLYQEFLVTKAARTEPFPEGDNQAFIKILIEKLGMTKAGATTYNYNMKKKFGGAIEAKPKKIQAESKGKGSKTPAKQTAPKSKSPAKKK